MEGIDFILCIIHYTSFPLLYINGPLRPEGKALLHASLWSPQKRKTIPSFDKKVKREVKFRRKALD